MKRYLAPITVTLFVAFMLINQSTSTAQAFESLPNSLRYRVGGQNGTADIKATLTGSQYTGVFFVQPGQSVELELSIWNKSRNPRGQVWYGLSSLLPEGPQYPYAHAIGIGTTSPQDHVPTFLDPSSFIIHGNRFAYYDGYPVGKNYYVAINWTVKMASNLAPGEYILPVKLVREFDSWGVKQEEDGSTSKYQSNLYKFVVGQTQEQYEKNYKDSLAKITGTFINTAAGYKLTYYPGVNGMIGSNDMGADPADAFNIRISDAGFWDKPFSIDIMDLGNVYGASDSMTLQDYARVIWQQNKNASHPNLPNKSTGDLVYRKMAGQDTYEFSLTDFFTYRGATGEGSWVLRSPVHVTFFRASKGKIMTVIFNADNEIAQQIVGSITL